MGVAGLEQNRYTEEDRERALVELAFCNGNSRLASKRLEARGVNIPWRTLADWPHIHAERYEQVRQQLAPRIAEKIAAEAESLAIDLADAERQTLTKYLSGLEQLDPKDAAAALRNLTTSKALQVDKISSPLRGRPTVKVEHTVPEQILDKIGRMLGLQTDIPDADVVELPEYAEEN